MVFTRNEPQDTTTDGSATADTTMSVEEPPQSVTDPEASTPHKASTPRTKEALRVFKNKSGLCEVETCEQKSLPASAEEETQNLCQNHLENGVEAPSEPAKRGRKRKASEEVLPSTPTCTPTTPTSEPRSRIKSCLVEGCEKLRAKSGYCLRHFKDKKAPIRSGPAEYERRICVIEGCERLRSKGDHCHRHHKDPKAPIRNKSDGPVDRKKKCGIENCDRLQVKGGFCSRHFRNRSAPVLTTPAFSFDADARWDELFPQLQAFYKKNGHSRVPTSQKTDLARFVVHIRCVYRTKKQKMLKAEQDGVSADQLHPDLTKSKLLTPERMEALKTVNFEFQLWTVEPSQWEQRFQELLAYRREHGNFHVTNKQNATLSSWCKTQRQRYKNTMAIYQGLYGVELTCPQKKAKELYEKAKEKAKEVKDNAEASDNKQTLLATPSLSDIGEAKNMMDPERICKLNAVGFEWELQKDTYVESWENRYNQLLKFKVVNGHCRVPKSSGDNPQLGQWVKQMRKYHGWKEDGKPYPTTFTEERIARLNELGFEWRLKDTPMKASLKAEDTATTPNISARILNTQLNQSVDVAPLQQYQQPATIPTLGANTNGTVGENGQKLDWVWGNNGYDAGNSAGV